MSRAGGLYIEGKSFFHQMDGAVKLILLLVWTVTTFLFLDARVFMVMLAFGIGMLLISGIPLKRMAFLFWVLAIFTILNSLLILLLTPRFGSSLTGSDTPLIPLGYNTINQETLFYVLTLSMKYLTLLPFTLLFIYTTHPSRFAASLNKLGVPYKMAYSVSIAFRYIPDLTREVKMILNALQMRGLGVSREDGSIKQRIKNLSRVIVPLLQSSLAHIDQVSDAMDLRGFGTNRRRTWYMGSRMSRSDQLVLIASLLLLGCAIVLRLHVFRGFWYPFV